MAQRLGEHVAFGYHNRLMAEARDLARRFKKQIFLSVDIPPAALGVGQGLGLVLEAERGVVERLSELEKQ